MNTNEGLSSSTRQLMYNWILFAVISAGIAGVLAFMVAMTRTPVVRLLPTAQSFYVVLAGHVTFAFLIWLLAFAAALWVYAGALARGGTLYSSRLGNSGIILAVVGSALLLASVVLGQGKVVLTDYIPVLENPVYVTGYFLFALGILATVVNFLLSLATRKKGQPLPLVTYGMTAAAICALMATIAGVVAYITLILRPASAITPVPYEMLFWGLGHALQYVNILIMVVSWYLLVTFTLGNDVVPGRLVAGIFGLAALFTLPIPFFYLRLDPATLSLNPDPLTLPAIRQPGILLDSGLSLPAVLSLFLIGISVWQVRARWQHGSLRRRLWERPALSFGALSVSLFTVGLMIEPVGAHGTLRVPAHYHAVLVGGITMALMGLTYQLLPILGCSLPAKALSRSFPYIFGVGLLGIVAGLGWAGAMGAPRKTYDVAFQGISWLAPMNLMGLGAFLAALGGGAFIVYILIAMLRYHVAVSGAEVSSVEVSGAEVSSVRY